MIGYELSDADKAVIEHYEKALKERGLDGQFSLPHHQRSLLSVTELVGKSVMLKVFKALDLKGDEAKRLAWKLAEVDVPMTLIEVDKELRSVFDQRWIPVADRHPTEADTDKIGDVMFLRGGIEMPGRVASGIPVDATHWRRTGRV